MQNTLLGEVGSGKEPVVICVSFYLLESTGMYAACAHGKGGLMELALLSHFESAMHAALRDLKFTAVDRPLAIVGLVLGRK